ncbi:MAG: hypothetical protein HS111_36185 [Kofleriaceae bacterium]|nr:hypothetical protein [Kofleriaceae bacterium]
MTSRASCACRRRPALDELTRGTFQRLIVDPRGRGGRRRPPALCSGKIFYELVEERKRRGASRTMIVRGAALPVPQRASSRRWRWPRWREADAARVQDEPGNMGAATFILRGWPACWADAAPGEPVVDDSASPATGSHQAHVLEQKRILAGAFGAPDPDPNRSG